VGAAGKAGEKGERVLGRGSKCETMIDIHVRRREGFRRIPYSREKRSEGGGGEEELGGPKEGATTSLKGILLPTAACEQKTCSSFPNRRGREKRVGGGAARMESQRE